MRLSRSFAAAGAAYCLQSLAPACALALSVGFPIQISHKDPAELRFVEEWEVYRVVHDTLLISDSNENLRGVLAQSWRFDEKKRRLRFTLRPGLEFSDGSPIRGEDVAFSVRRTMFLDEEGSHPFSKCFNSGRPLGRLDAVVPTISVPNERTVEFEISACPDIILELAQESSGVLSPRAVDPRTGLFTDPRIVSGLFYRDSLGSPFVLRANLKNWRIPPGAVAAGKRHETLSFLHVAPEDAVEALLAGKIDLFRTSNDSVLGAARRAGLTSRISLSALTWYLTPAETASGVPEIVRATLDDLNASLDRTAMFVQADDALLQPTNEFLPSDFGCGPSRKRARHVRTAAQRRATPLHLIPHPSNEGVPLIEPLLQAVSRLGYDMTTGNNPAPRRINLRLNRQFLGDEKQQLLDFVFNLIHAIPDPGGKLSQMLGRVRKLPEDRMDAGWRSLCDAFHHYNHVPIAHASLAAVAIDPAALESFSRVSGSILFDRWFLKELRQ